MAKFACPNCGSPIEATPDLKVIVCPGCGKKYRNPKYVEPTSEADSTPVREPIAEEQAPQAPIVQETVPQETDSQERTTQEEQTSAEQVAQETAAQEQAPEEQTSETPTLPCNNCKTPIVVTPDLEIVTCPGCGKKYRNPNYVAPQQASDAPETAPEATAPAPAPAATSAATNAAPVNESKFTGTMISWLGHHLFNILMTVITLGIGYPWVLCRQYRWKISHQIIDGHKLKFEGKGGSLLGHWLLWVLLTIVTIGIYGLWVPCKVQAWITERTHIDDTPAE